MGTLLYPDSNNNNNNNNNNDYDSMVVEGFHNSPSAYFPNRLLNRGGSDWTRQAFVGRDFFLILKRHARKS